MSQKINIFFTGATGYIGGSVLCRLIDHPDANSFAITALVRSPEKAAKLEKLGVKAVVGSHSDPVITEQLASAADYVIATADADNMGAAKAILSGLKKRFESTGKPPVLIHTSGTGVLTDKSAGDDTNDVIYDDLNPDQIETLPDSQLHRDVDLTLLQADKDGYVRVYIVVPSTIYGIAKGKLVDAGIQNPHSIQVPALIYTAIARRQAGTIGAGKNFWPDVNVEDVADLYLVVFNAIRSDPDKVGHGRSGFFFGENGEHQMFEISQAIGKALVELGLATDSSYTPFTKEEIDKHFQGSTYLGTNSRCRSNHGRSLGWKPKYTKEDFLATIKAEVEVLAAKGDQRTEYRQ